METEADKAVPEKVQTDLPEAGKYHLVITGELPSSRIETGNRGFRVYGPKDSRTNVIGYIHLGPEQVEQLGPHCGVEYEIRIRPMPLQTDSPDIE